jgi:hypothetical protein
MWKNMAAKIKKKKMFGQKKIPESEIVLVFFFG